MNNKHYFQKKPLSWSAISSFTYDPEQWARKYVDQIFEQPNNQMRFGNDIGTRLATEPAFLPDVGRHRIFEKKLEGKIGDIQLVGFLDSYDPETHAFYEYKTSSNSKKWTQKSAQDHGQILMYMFLIWMNYRIAPDDIACTLYYIPVNETGDFGMELTKDAKVKAFPVKHTALEVLRFANRIRDIYDAMVTYADAHVADKTPVHN